MSDVHAPLGSQLFVAVRVNTKRECSILETLLTLWSSQGKRNLISPFTGGEPVVRYGRVVAESGAGLGVGWATRVIASVNALSTSSGSNPSER